MKANRFRSLAIPALALAMVAGAAAQTAPPAGGQLTAQQLQQLVAPIALYPDEVVAQVLAASTYPTQVVEADRWLQAHKDLAGKDLANAVSQQDWDSSVKALCEYAAVLEMMDQNLTWTSDLGDAYYNQPDDVMDAIQAMRKQAQTAGTLKNTPQAVVTNVADGTVTIEPPTDTVIYLPEYDPWTCYGPVFAPWYPWIYPPGWYVGVGIFYGPPWPLGFWLGFGWSFHAWLPVWHSHRVFFGHEPFVTHSATVIQHPAPRPNAVMGRQSAPTTATHPPVSAPKAPASGVDRGFSPPPGGAQGTHSSVFSGFGNGGAAAGAGARGGASMSAPAGGGGHGRGRES